FADATAKIECWLDGYKGDLYGQSLTIRILHEIRPLQTFDSPEQLIAQIHRDVAECRRLVERYAAANRTPV
ncbi:MAG: riboflavin kinase, partial [Planctomycetaceae bacterium]|nr:riboflavin kinase [Planctomycetaceae bacterium]